MKTKKLRRKLAINKRTIANLSDEMQRLVKGGDFTCPGCGYTCAPYETCDSCETCVTCVTCVTCDYTNDCCCTLKGTSCDLHYCESYAPQFCP